MEYQFKTRIGTFRIVHRFGQWHAMLDDESLGPYGTPELALDDLVGGHCHWPAPGVDPSTFGLPDNLADWVVVPGR